MCVIHKQFSICYLIVKERIKDSIYSGKLSKLTFVLVRLWMKILPLIHIKEMSHHSKENVKFDRRERRTLLTEKYLKFHKCENKNTHIIILLKIVLDANEKRKKIDRKCLSEMKWKTRNFTYFSIFFLSCIYSIFSCHFHHRINAKEMMRSRRRMSTCRVCARHNEINFEKV